MVVPPSRGCKSQSPTCQKRLTLCKARMICGLKLGRQGINDRTINVLGSLPKAPWPGIWECGHVRVKVHSNTNRRAIHTAPIYGPRGFEEDRSLC
jgi:hypothetical protein